MWQDMKVIMVKYITRNNGVHFVETFENMGALGWWLDSMGWDTRTCDEYELVDIRVVEGSVRDVDDSATIDES